MHERTRRSWVALLLGCSSGLWGCTSTEAAPQGEVETTSSSSDSPEPALIEGTQTGGEGEAVYCGEGAPNWQPVPETIPFPTHYAGRLELDGGGSVATELSLSNLGAVYALELAADAGLDASCAEGRQGELDWALNVEGVLQAGQSARVVYSEGYRGELGDTFDIDELGLQQEPPTADDFRAAGDPAPWAPGDGPVRIDVYLHLGDATANIELRWSCWSCGSSRIALPLAKGTLVAGDAVETLLDTPER
jgi:hypothetical protein